MFGCDYGARYVFNSWTGGCLPPYTRLKDTHGCDKTPWNDFKKNPDGHMTFFDMYPHAEGRWFKYTPAFLEKRIETVRKEAFEMKSNVKIFSRFYDREEWNIHLCFLTEPIWAIAKNGGCMNNYHRYVDFFERKRHAFVWYTDLSCGTIFEKVELTEQHRNRAFRAIMQAWHDTQCPRVHHLESEDPRNYLGYRLVSPSFDRDEWALRVMEVDKRITVAMGLHKRLGADSFLCNLDDETLRTILSFKITDIKNMPDRVEPCYD